MFCFTLGNLPADVAARPDSIHIVGYLGVPTSGVTPLGACLRLRAGLTHILRRVKSAGAMDEACSTHPRAPPGRM